MQEVDDRPVKEKKIEYRFKFFWQMGQGGMYDSSETAQNLIRRADADEKDEVAKWADSATPGQTKLIQKGYGLIVCTEAKGMGTKVTVDVYPDEEGYDELP